MTLSRPLINAAVADVIVLPYWDSKLGPVAENFCEQVASLRAMAAAQRGARDTAGFNLGGREAAQGVRAECAAAAILGVRWTLPFATSMKTVKRARSDVGGWQIRSQGPRDPHLIHRPGDRADDTFILAVERYIATDTRRGIYYIRLAGWATGHQIRSEGTWANPGSDRDPSRKPAWFFRWSLLNPMEKLPGLDAEMIR